MITRDLLFLMSMLKAERASGRTVAWTNGCFDIIHPGHIETFRQAHRHADILVVGLNGDHSPYFRSKPGRPINDENFRAAMLAALGSVDHVYIFDDDVPLGPVMTLRPEIYLKGGDWDIEKIPEAQVVREYGGKAIAIPTVSGYSTTNVIRRILDVYGKE